MIWQGILPREKDQPSLSMRQYHEAEALPILPETAPLDSVY